LRNSTVAAGAAMLCANAFALLDAAQASRKLKARPRRIV
jgi:hypothetical protein